MPFAMNSQMTSVVSIPGESSILNPSGSYSADQLVLDNCVALIWLHVACKWGQMLVVQVGFISPNTRFGCLGGSGRCAEWQDP